MADAQVAARQRVLIVDDDESMRLLLAGMVSRQLDAQVELAGFAVLHKLRASRLNARTPVIVVSAAKAAAERTLAAGADAILVKPVRSAEVAAIIRKHLFAST